MIGINKALFSSTVRHFAISIRLSIQIIRTESESSIARILNYLIYPWRRMSFFTYLQSFPICLAKERLKIKESSEIIPTILLRRVYWSFWLHFGKISLIKFNALILGGNFFWDLSFKISGTIILDKSSLDTKLTIWTYDYIAASLMTVSSLTNNLSRRPIISILKNSASSPKTLAIPKTTSSTSHLLKNFSR